MEILSADKKLYIRYDDNHYALLEVSANGSLTITSTSQVNFNNVKVYNLDVMGVIQIAAHNTPKGTTGAQTINKAAGIVNFAACQQDLLVYNTLVSENSIIIPTIMRQDTAANSAVIEKKNDAFTIHLNQAPIAELEVGFLVIN